MEQDSDEALVQAIQNGSVSAFEVLVKRYQHKLYSFVYKVVWDDADAQEVVQDTFVKVYQAVSRIDVSRKFSTFLFEVAKNTAISTLRKRRANRPLSDAESIETDEVIIERLVARETAQEVKKAIDALEYKYRAVIRLYYYQDLSYEEISKKQHIPVNTVRTYLYRAKAILKKELSP